MSMFNKSLPIESAVEGLSELVKVYSLKYQENLERQKERVQSQIDSVLAERNKFRNSVIESADPNQYAHTSDVLGIRSRIHDVNIEMNEYEPVLVVTLMLEDLDDISGSMRLLGKNKRVPLYRSVYAKDKKFADQLTELNAHMKYLRSRSIAEKESEIRTKLIEIRLRKTDLAYLVDNEEVLALIR